MSRPHEDRQRHTATDHHSGGPAIVFAPVETLPERPGVTFVDLPPDAGEIDVGAAWLRGEEYPLRDKFVDALANASSEWARSNPR